MRRRLRGTAATTGGGSGRPVGTVGIVDKGGSGSVPPSAAIRAHRRARNSVGSALAFERLDPGEYAAGGTPRLDVLLVVRDALPVAAAGRVLDRAASEGTRVVLDLDDDLVTDHATARLVGQGYDAERLAVLRELLGGAGAVTVSTATLADLVRPLTEAAVLLLPNELDPLLWAGEPPAGTPEPQSVPDEVRLLYMGSKTHQGDLALLDGLPGALAERLAAPVTLELVGVTAGDLPAGTRRLVPDKSNYAGFVRWLRRNQDRWHAAVAPLDDTPFNAAKSDLKLLEYAALEVAAVASPSGPYAGADPALALPAAGRAAWVDALEAVVRQRAEDGPAADARDWVLAHRTMTQESVSAWHRMLTGGAVAGT